MKAIKKPARGSGARAASKNVAKVKATKEEQKKAELAKMKLEAKQTGRPQAVSRYSERDGKGALRKGEADGFTGAAITKKSAAKRVSARKAEDVKIKARSLKLKSKKK